MTLPTTLKDWVWLVLAVVGGIATVHTVLNAALEQTLKEIASDSATIRVSNLVRHKCAAPEDWTHEYEAILQKHLARYNQLNGREYDTKCPDAP